MFRYARVLGVLLLMAVFMVTVDASTAHEPADTTVQLAQTTGADLSITKSDNIDPIARGQTVVYTVLLSNAGPDNGINVVVTDTLPPGTNLAGGTSPVGWNCVAPPGQVRCTKSDVPPGNYTFTINVFVPGSYSGPEPLVNNINVVADNDPNGANNSASEVTSFAVPLSATAACINGQSDLQVSITAGNGPFNITGTGSGLPLLGVGTGTFTFLGPDRWDNVAVAETEGDLEVINFGNFKCRGSETPLPISPANNSTIPDTSPTFTWTAVTGAINYRLLLADSLYPASGYNLYFTPGTSITIPDVLAPGQYFWRVAARIDYVFTRWSPVSTFFVSPPPLTFAPPNSTNIVDDDSNGSVVTSPQVPAVISTDGSTPPDSDPAPPNSPSDAELPAPPNSR